MIEVKIRRFDVFAGLWFTALLAACTMLFWEFVGANESIAVLDTAFMSGAFLWGCVFGNSLNPKIKTVTKIRVVIAGVAVPTLAFVTAFAVSGILSCGELLSRGHYVDATIRMIMSVPMSIIAGVSALLVTFWLFWPIGILGAWVLVWYNKKFGSRSINRNY